jgi:hypothetical protein
LPSLPPPSSDLFFEEISLLLYHIRFSRKKLFLPTQKLTHFNHKPEKDTDKSPEICKKRKKINRFTRKMGEWACQKRPSPVYSSQRQARRCWFRMAAALRAAGGKKTRGRNYGQAEAEHYRIPEL